MPSKKAREPSTPTDAILGARCPCGSSASFDRCCWPVISQEREAPTAEALMRSRFSAYCIKDARHLLRSWSPSTCPSRVMFPEAQEWLSLEVRSVSRGGLLDQAGTVEFVASFRIAASDNETPSESAIHELSSFERHEGRWVYINGVHDPEG